MQVSNVFKDILVGFFSSIFFFLFLVSGVLLFVFFFHFFFFIQYVEFRIIYLFDDANIHSTHVTFEYFDSNSKRCLAAADNFS